MYKYTCSEEFDAKPNYCMSASLFSLISAMLITLTVFNDANAEEIKIVTWNVKDCMDLKDVERRSSDLAAMASHIEPDILILQEVTSRRVVERIAEVMDLDGFYIACSDFAQSDASSRSAFEVAIVSRFPFGQVIEYDPTPDNSDDDDPEELRLEAPRGLAIPRVGTSRGYLWARLYDYPLTLFAVHLKSSLGEVGVGDLRNAAKREFVMSAVAAGVVEDMDAFEEHSHVVAGDFNVGHSDIEKNGEQLHSDDNGPSATGDLYDETHALLHAGLVDGLQMRNVAFDIKESTYPNYPGSPIDNIYVDGYLRDSFTPAQTTEDSETYGSDHKPVWTTVDMDG